MEDCGVRNKRTAACVRIMKAIRHGLRAAGALIRAPCDVSHAAGAEESGRFHWPEECSQHPCQLDKHVAAGQTGPTPLERPRSAGQLVHARSGEGAKLIELAIREEITPGVQMHKKEVFL